MNIGRININGVETTVSLGIDEDEIERNEVNDDTLRLDEVVEVVKDLLDEEHNGNWEIFKINKWNI